MSAPINDGGPAFPTPAGIQHNDGMTLRDYFAAAALQGMLGGLDRNTARFLDSIPFPAGKLASASYNCADAMLKVKEAKP
jgi:hypothetical protein